MLNFINTFLTLRKAKKARASLRGEYRLYQDVIEHRQALYLDERFKDLDQAIAGREIEDLPHLIETLRAEVQDALPPRRFRHASDFFDLIVSALAVAFCFRAYFYEPFRIPTGSMQPTLYGVHGETWAPSQEEGLFDAPGLRTLKWLVTGTTLEDVVIKRTGRVLAWRNDLQPGYATLVVHTGRGNPDLYHLPEYTLPTPETFQRYLTSTFPVGSVVREGCRIWRGTVTSGDFVFVNRWIWNFRHPRLGETIVFSTQDIEGLPPHQHYIKRLCGRPGDKVEIKPTSTHLWVNDEAMTSPKRFSEIAEHIIPWEGAPAYDGYLAAPLSQANPYPVTRWELKEEEYLAFGDNSKNSYDSRYWGTVPARNLLGPATFIHWPFKSPRWGSLR